MIKPIINLEHIDITFRQKKRVIEAVKDVSIVINKGDIYGIVVLSGEAFALAGAQEAIVAAGIELTVLKRGA